MALARYLTAAVGARLADEGARVAIVLLVLDRTGDPGLGGLLVAALMVPHVVAAPLAGRAADRSRRRKPLYLAAFGIYALVLGGSAVLVGRRDWAAAGLLVVGGCVAPLLLGGLSSLVGALVPPERVAHAYSLDATTYGLAGIVGPALAAAIAGFAGASWSLVALGGFVLAGLLVFATLPLPVPTARSEEPQPLLAGLAAMVRRPRLGAVTLASGFSMLGVGALPLAAAALASGRPALVGWLLTAGASGGLIGSLLCTRLPFVHRFPVRVRWPAWPRRRCRTRWPACSRRCPCSSSPAC